MITYEVTATVEPPLVAAYEAWLRDEHVPALLATGCFVGASILRSGDARFRIRYDARDRAELARYLAEHAPRLREDGMRRFPTGVRLEREEWTLVAATTGAPPATRLTSPIAHVHQSIAHVALVVADYDDAIAFYVGKLGFTLVEDTYQPEQDKRWVVVAPPGSTGASLLLARATTPEQARTVGNQTGGRVFLFLRTDDFWRDYRAMTAKGITFVRPPSEQPYGTVAVFEDLYGTKWDLVEYRA